MSVDAKKPVGTRASVNWAGMQVVRTDAEIDCKDIDDAIRQAGAELVLLSESCSEEKLVEATCRADVLLMCYTPITRSVIASAQRLKGIVKYGVGIDAIDMAAAAEFGIPVVNVPDYADNTVAEAAFCMTLCLLRKLMPMTAAIQSSGWLYPVPEWLGRDLAGKTVALIGTGHIGQAYARMAGPGFQARVIAYDPYRSEGEMAALGIEKYQNLHAMLAVADIVSVHCVLNDETLHLVGEAEFDAMLRQPVFVNVSRGAIVDEDAMIRALDSGRISGAGLDVFSQEPMAQSDHPLASLYGRDNVILLPHLAFYTVEAMQRLTNDTLDRCAEILGQSPVTINSTDPRLRSQAGRLTFT